MAHEALHVLLNRLGMLLYGSPRYFQHKNTPGGPHIHQLHQEVNVFGINLNTDGDEFSEQSDYDDAKRIYPVQRYYVQKFWDYFYLKDTDLMAALSPDNGQYITPIISRWQTIRNRFKVILKDGSGIRYSLFSGDDNDNVKLKQQNFYSNNPFIFE